MAWTKKTGTLPDKVKTLIVVDPTDSNIKDLGDSANIEGTNISRSNATNVVNVDRTTGGWGIGVYTGVEAGTFNPGEVRFTAVSASRPKWVDAAAGDAGGTVIMLFNRIRSGDNVTSKEFMLISDANQPVFRTDASIHGQVGASSYTTGSTGTTVLPTDTAFGMAMYAKRSATNDWKYFYGTQAGGTFTQEGTAGSINDAGIISTLQKLGANAANQPVPYELFALVVAPTDFLSSTELNSILSDPVGTLVNTGAAASFLPLGAQILT